MTYQSSPNTSAQISLGSRSQSRTVQYAKDKVTNEEVLEQIGEKRTLLNNILVEKPIGSVVFWVEIAPFMVPLKYRWRKWMEGEEEGEQSSLMWEAEEDIGG